MMKGFKVMIKSKSKIFFLYQLVGFSFVGIFLSSCESLRLERHKARCEELGFKEGSQEMEKCMNDLLKKEKKNVFHQTYNSAQGRAQQHLDSAQIKWKKRKLQRQDDAK